MQDRPPLWRQVGLALGAASGMIAGVAFKQEGKMIGHGDEAP